MRSFPQGRLLKWSLPSGGVKQYLLVCNYFTWAYIKLKYLPTGNDLRDIENSFVIVSNIEFSFIRPYQNIFIEGFNETFLTNFPIYHNQQLLTVKFNTLFKQEVVAYCTRLYTTRWLFGKGFVSYFLSFYLILTQFVSLRSRRAVAPKRGSSHSITIINRIIVLSLHTKVLNLYS